MSLGLLPEAGGAMLWLTRGGVDLLRGRTWRRHGASGLGGFPLIPFSGPVPGEPFRFSGREHRLDRNHPSEPEPVHGVLRGTLLLAFQVMLCCLAIGFPAALFLWQRQGLVRWALLLATALPLFLSCIIKVYAIRSLMGPLGLVNQALIASGLT